jgi:alpha-tubulin suppressor-like RCC1 family protein
MGAALPVVALGTGKTAKALALGNAHSCAILNDDTVKCWGENSDGQLGLGDVVTRGDGANEMGDALPAVSLGVGKTAKALTARGSHTCALLSDDTVKCWGGNGQGGLGLGDTMKRGDAANEMGDALASVDLGLGLVGKGVFGGLNFTCAVLKTDRVKCWGRNAVGQLGQGDTTNRGDGVGPMGNGLPAISLGEGRTVKSLAVGINHACALLNNNAVKCWGGALAGQLGLGDEQSRGDGIGEMGDALPAVLVFGM